MKISEQRYEVLQLFAEAREKGWPLLTACMLVAAWFDKNGITLPASIVDWLERTATDTQILH